MPARSLLVLGMFGCSASPGSSPPALSRDAVIIEAGPFVAGIDDAELEGVVELCSRFAGGRCDRRRLIEHHRGETPRRTVALARYAIDRLEVSNDRFRRCEQAGACRRGPLEECFEAGGDARLGAAGAQRIARRGDHPVVCVTPAEAARYCRWAGGRLPSDDEWEKAARGADGRRFPWGDAWAPHRANASEDAGGDGHLGTAAGGAFPAGASPYGALDMAGNVWEWVGGASDSIMRGGGYAAMPIGLRTTKRVVRAPPGAYENIGFRCVY